MSNDNGKPKLPWLDDGYQVVTREDVADENAKVQARRIDLLTAETRTGFALLNETVKNGLERVTEALSDLADRLTELEKRPRARKRK